MQVDLSLPSPRHLAGDLAIWIFILAELLAFGVFFAAYAFTRARHPALFEAGQQLLDRNAGAINTLLLLSASALAARRHRLRFSLPRRQGP